MRISEQTRATEFMRSIDLQSTKLNALYQKLSTQKQVNEPSDDPVATGTIMRTQAYLDGLNQNVASISSAQNFAQAASTSLSDSTDLLAQVQTLAVQGANATESGAARTALGSQVNQLLESIVQDANGQFEGRYTFSGTKTDTAPVAVTRDAQGQIQGLTYQGSAAGIALPVGQGRTAAVSVTAKAAFVDSGVLDAVKSLRDDLTNSQGLSDSDQQAAISADIAALKTAQNGLLTQAGEVGLQSAQLDSLTQQTQTAITQAQSMLSSVQDVDAGQVAVDLQSAETVYQAVLSTGAKIMQHNGLISYLT